MSATSNKPVKTFRARGVKASVFANITDSAGREITYHKVSLQKVYKDGNEFKTTTSLGRDDLPVACLLMRQAWEFILGIEANKTTEEDS